MSATERSWMFLGLSSLLPHCDKSLRAPWRPHGRERHLRVSRKDWDDAQHYERDRRMSEKSFTSVSLSRSLRQNRQVKEKRERWRRRGRPGVVEGDIRVARSTETKGGKNGRRARGRYIADDEKFLLVVFRQLVGLIRDVLSARSRKRASFTDCDTAVQKETMRATTTYGELLVEKILESQHRIVVGARRNRAQRNAQTVHERLKNSRGRIVP